jgi:GTP-binding protein
LVVTSEPGTTRDAIDTTFVREDHTYTFIDTAGFRRKSKVYKRLEYYSVLRAVRAIERADVVIHLIDAREIVEQDAKIAGLAHDRGKAVIIACNKWDLVERKEERKETLQNELARKLWHVSYAPVIYTSALTAKGLGSLWELFEQVGRDYKKRIPTAQLNTFLENLLTQHSPPVIGSGPLKIYYMTQTHTGPPTFILFTNREKDIPATYQRFILNQIRETFGFLGSPLWVKFRKRGKEKPKK